MEAQCRFLLENRIDDPPRMTLLKLPSLGLLLSTGATFMLCKEPKVNLLNGKNHRYDDRAIHTRSPRPVGEH
jgi:hypothetical protein